MRHVPLVLLLATAVLSPAARAAPPGGARTVEPVAADTLTVPEAVSRALGYRPEVAGARAERRRAASGLEEARAALRPSVEASARALHHDEPVPVTPFHGFGTGGFPEFETTLLQGTLRLDWLLWDGGRRAARIEGAGAEAEAAVDELDDAAQQIVGETVETYLRVLTLGTTLRSADARIEAFEAERHRVGQLLEVGRAPAVEMRRAEAALAAARADRVRLRSGLETAEGDLARLMGTERSAARFSRLRAVAPGGTASSAGATDVPDREALARSLDESPRLAAARRRLAAAEAAVRVAEGADRPTLAAFSDLQQLGSTGGTFEGEWSAGLRVRVPILRGGALEEREVQARAGRDAVGERLRRTRLELEAELDATLAALHEARARQRALTEAERQLVEVVRIEKLRLETGVGLQADYLDAEASLLDARTGLAEARHAEVAARVRLARLTGALDLGWVERELAGAPRGRGPAVYDESALQ